MIHRRPTTAFARAGLRLLCVLLLFAQQIGLSHAVWHASQQVPQPASAAIGDKSDAPKLPHASKLCPLDAALGQVLGAAGVTSFAFAFAQIDAHAFACAPHASASVHALTARSRGPPALL